MSSPYSCLFWCFSASQWHPLLFAAGYMVVLWLKLLTRQFHLINRLETHRSRANSGAPGSRFSTEPPVERSFAVGHTRVGEKMARTTGPGQPDPGLFSIS
jgi:hypothetical protein